MNETTPFRTESAAGYRVTVYGNIDSASATGLAQNLVRIAAAPWDEQEKSKVQGTLVLDLSHVDYINSTGIGALLRCRQAAEEHNRKILVIIHQGLADIFEIANLYSLFEVVMPCHSITGQDS
ncbi:MAG: STAS domain-containing protein [bacterium]